LEGNFLRSIKGGGKGYDTGIGGGWQRFTQRNLANMFTIENVRGSVGNKEWFEISDITGSPIILAIQDGTKIIGGYFVCAVRGFPFCICRTIVAQEQGDRKYGKSKLRHYTSAEKCVSGKLAGVERR
jgi:hypothetical protein